VFPLAGMPLIPTVIYSIVRGSIANDRWDNYDLHLYYLLPDITLFWSVWNQSRYHYVNEKHPNVHYISPVHDFS